MNSFHGIGRLTATPELQKTGSNRPYARFTIAINNNYVDADGNKVEQADFINCVAWNNTAENLCKYQKKGNQIAVTGRLHPYSYDKEDGTKGYSYDIIVNSLEYLDSKPKDERPEPEYTGKDSVIDTENDPFAEYGENVTIDDNFLD